MGDADLLARNPDLTATLSDEVWTINPVVGGPIVPDRVWFFATHTSQKADTVAGGIFHETFVPGTTATRIMARWFSGATERNSPKHTHMARTSVSYVTGSHNMKFGMTGLWLGENAINSNHNDWRYGWGNRQANWEITASIQQQLVDGLSLDVGYFRRSWVNFYVEDDRNLGTGETSTNGSQRSLRVSGP